MNFRHWRTVSDEWRDGARVSLRTTAAPCSDCSHEHDLGTWYITAATNDISQNYASQPEQHLSSIAVGPTGHRIAVLKRVDTSNSCTYRLARDASGERLYVNEFLNTSVMTRRTKKYVTMFCCQGVVLYACIRWKLLCFCIHSLNSKSFQIISFFHV